MTSRASNPEKETILLHGLPPQVEESLIERASARGCDVADEAADIIEQHIAESSGEII